MRKELSDLKNDHSQSSCMYYFQCVKEVQTHKSSWRRNCFARPRDRNFFIDAIKCDDSQEFLKSLLFNTQMFCSRFLHLKERKRFVNILIFKMACLCPTALAVGWISAHPIYIAISPPTLVEQQVGRQTTL